jgi:hypothetical protein
MTRLVKPAFLIALPLVAAVAISTPAWAQPARPPAIALQDDAPPVSARAFGLVTVQQFAAQDTFDAAFGSTTGAFVGGGLEVVHASGFFAAIELSRVSKSGSRAFVSDGKAFSLGIPLKATITPIDVMAGYRFRIGDSERYILYAAGGATSIGYKETSDFSDASDDVDVRKTGFIVLGGVEVRVARLLGVSVDVADTHVTGIIGDAGISQQFGEKNIGGVAARVRVIVGR